MECGACGLSNDDGARFCASCGNQLGPSGAEAWIGQLVGGRFRIVRVLGEGGMGIVYAAEQQMGSTLRKVAIKTLHPHLSRDASVRARFDRECGTVAELEHPNTIKVYDFGSAADGTLYIAMEFVEGRSLEKVLREEGPLAPARVVRILEQVAGALDEAHQRGIIHRDLKPDNIVLGERLGNPDFVKVLDFGIAARSESTDQARQEKLTQQGMVLGTPPYMSPEQFTGQALDRRSDIYSLGVMVYEMLTGTLPFEADTPWQWATMHMTAAPMPLEQTTAGRNLSPRLQDVVMRALAKQPTARPASAGEFVRELAAAIEVTTGPVSVARTEVMQAPLGALAEASRTTSAGAAAGGPVTAAAMSATQPIQIPVNDGGGKKWWIFGLAAAVAAAGGAFAWMQRPVPAPLAADPSPAAAEPSPSSTAPAAAPIASAPPAASPTAPPEVPGSSPPAGVSGPVATTPPATKPPTKSPSGQRPTGTGTSTGSGTSTGGGASTQVKDPVPTGPGCSAAEGLISSGAWAQAKAAWSQCDATQKAQLTSFAKRAAATQVKAAGKDCTRIAAIIKGAKGIGASSPRFDADLEQCRSR